jgi:hypothetical protein
MLLKALRLYSVPLHKPRAYAKPKIELQYERLLGTRPGSSVERARMTHLGHQRSPSPPLQAVPRIIT